MHQPLSACPPIQLTVLTPGSPSGSGWLAIPLNVTLRHGNTYIEQSPVGAGKTVDIYGAVPGDSIHVSKPELIDGKPYITSGEATITSCGPITITTQTWLSYSPMPIPIPSIDPETNDFMLFLDTQGKQALVRANLGQDGQKAQDFHLTFDERRGGYIGRLATQRDRALNFTLGVDLSDIRGVTSHMSYRYTARMFHWGHGAIQEPFPAHNPVNLGLTARSLPEGTKVLAGTTSMPAPAPEGMAVVGGPYSIAAGGDAVLDDLTALTLNFTSGAADGIDSRSIAVYRYERGAWLPLDTTVNAEHGEAYTSSFQWGVYAVFARPAR
jgi:hypothetical protein